MSIFKDCDIRGIYGPELNEETARTLGQALGAELAGRDVAVAGDLRLSTPALKAALVEGLLRTGARVIDLGQIPTPAFYDGKARLGAYGGVMVTASHNPAQYNGFKLMLGDLPVIPEDVQQIAQRMAAGHFPEAQGSYREEKVLPAYVDALVAAFPGLTARRIVVDAGNGSLSLVAPDVLRRAGQQVDELYCTPDGSFPHRNPNPAIPAHLGDLRTRVLATRAELGVAYDGDGDRVIFVDERARVQPADRTLVLFLRHILRSHAGGKVVYDLKSSSVVADETRRSGGQPLMERSGHAFIKRRLLTEGAVLGGEISGHYFFGALGGDDALYATLYLLQALDALGLTFAAAMDTVPTYPITPDLRLPCPPEHAREILDELREAFRAYPQSALDGVRIQFPAGWALARISVTEPLITLRFEAHSEAELAAIQQQVRQSSPLLDKLMAANGL